MLVEVTHILGLVQVTQSCPTLCDPMDCSTPGFPVHHQIQELAQTHVHQVSDAIQLSHPLSSPSPSAFNLSQHQGLFLCLPPVFPTPVTSPSVPCSPLPGPSPGRLPLVDLSSPVTQSKTRISKDPYPGLSHRRHVYQRSTRTGPWHRQQGAGGEVSGVRTPSIGTIPRWTAASSSLFFLRSQTFRVGVFVMWANTGHSVTPLSKEGACTGMCRPHQSLLHLDMFHKDQ